MAGETAHLDSFLLSCRILGKHIEDAFLIFVLNQLKQQSIRNVQAQYIPTAKNIQVEDFYTKNGFKIVARDEKGCINYNIDVSLQNFTGTPYFKIHTDKLNRNY
jgi:predicted enzyme involved in methoxymalonyl-ACP biosynthesis